MKCDTSLLEKLRTQRAVLLAIEKRVNAAFDDWSYREAVVDIDQMIKKESAR